MYLTDNVACSATDNKKFVMMQGNGGWQQLSLSTTLTQAATLSLHLYGDMYTSTSSSATDSTFVLYDDVLVSSNTRGTILSEDFESGISAWGACSGNLALAGPSTAPDQWKRDVIYLGSQAIAEVDAAGVHELHNDYQGTPRVITNRTTGAVEGTQAFGPYGEAMPAPFTSGYVPLTGYTGHMTQDSTGLVYMRGRFYSPAWHHFLNSDQGVDPNSWNQMAYVGGSPMMATDPSGLASRTECVGGLLYKLTQSSDGTWGGVFLVVDGHFVTCSDGGGGGDLGGGAPIGGSDPIGPGPGVRSGSGNSAASPKVPPCTPFNAKDKSLDHFLQNERDLHSGLGGMLGLSDKTMGKLSHPITTASAAIGAALSITKAVGWGSQAGIGSVLGGLGTELQVAIAGGEMASALTYGGQILALGGAMGAAFEVGAAVGSIVVAEAKSGRDYIVNASNMIQGKPCQ